jgi:hypothetical protein
MTIDQRIAEVAARQFGVISIAQLFALGLTRKEIEGRVARGSLPKLHRGVYAVGHRRIVDHAHLIVALLATGPEAFISHRSAAALWGLRALSTARIEVTVPGHRRQRKTTLWVHETGAALDPADLATRNGLSVSSVPRMLIELAPREHPHELKRLITQAIRKDILDLQRMEDALGRHARRPGVAVLKRALAGYRPKPERRSNLETAFDDWLAQHPEIPPPPLRNVKLGPWEIDCYWPQFRLAVELDSRPYHITVGDIERDRLKDTWLQRREIRAVRITGWRFEHDRAGILEDLRAFTGSAAA